MLNNPAVFAQPFSFDIALVDQADTKKFKAAPDIQSGDFKISIDGGALTNLASPPTVVPSGGVQVRVSLSASEMSGQNISVYWVDASGAEWCDGMFNVQPSAGSGAVRYGIAQAAASSTLTLDAGSAFANNELTGSTIVILSASTGAGQSRQIASNVGSTDVVTVDPIWTTTPTGTIAYAIFATPPAPANAIPDVNTKSISASAVTDIATGIDAIVVEPSLTVKGWRRVVGAMLAGLTSGAGTTSEQFKSLRNDGTAGKTRVTLPNDGTNRVATRVLDLTDEV